MMLNGRLVLKNGTGDWVNGGAGVWIYKSDNTALLGFMGAQNNQNIGFYGGPANGGWGFAYDAINSRVGIGTSTPTTSLEVNGYTKLGIDAPSIKTKKITGTTAATDGGYVEIYHGLNDAKILSISMLVLNIGPGYADWYGPNTGGFGCNYYFRQASNWILVQNRFGDSAGILSRPIKVLLVYEE